METCHDGEFPEMITLSLDRSAFREWMRTSRVPTDVYAIVFERLLQELAAHANGQPATLALSQAPPARQPGQWHLGPFSGETMAEWELVQKAARTTFAVFTEFAVVDPGYYTLG
jgi:hypothetical protein